ncbi:4-diphosphocytidyl-2-C-methyl-D-erythritol kinase [Dysgonomonadaceae bacterium PH5-43]|nr:4-diphosphocytidyl-2-C-methyl-D-erythritol kinase [Dysgonomonadaceae bacterium PH5-43]
MIVFPNAKINLGLNIVSKRDDGYHNIETVFYPIPLCDALEIVPAKTDKGVFTQSGIKIDGNLEDNLVCKAYNLLKNQYNLPEIDVYLLKKIPFGAGLGGGSSDAAFMLKLINDFAQLNLTETELEKYASQLGADCSFFIKNKPVFAEGIGNVFTSISLSLKGYRLVLIKPDIHVSTQEAYSCIKPNKPSKSAKDVVMQPVETWKYDLFNDFEISVFAKYPKIQEIKDSLYSKGAVYASMTGSGSSVFGLFNKEVEMPDVEYALYSMIL